MIMSKTIFNLQLFAEEGTGADTSSLAQSSAADVGTGPSAGTSMDGQAADNGEAESFDSLIKGKYKKEYDAKLKATMDKRFKNQMDYQKKYDSLRPALDMMAEKYGMDPSQDLDIEALTKKITDDKSLYEKEAFEKGIDVDTLMYQKGLERDNRYLRQMQQEQAQHEANVQLFNRLHGIAEEVKGIYPDFNLDAEMENPSFRGIMSTLEQAGDRNAMRTAYEVIHKDEIMATSMQYASQKTAQGIASTIMAGKGRPVENHMSSGGAAALSDKDPRTFTKADFERLKREAERGKKVYLT